MNILVGTQLGLVRLCNSQKIQFTFPQQLQSLERAVVSINPFDQDQYLIGHKNGLIEVVDMNERKKVYSSLFNQFNSCVVASYYSKQLDKLVIALENSEIKLCNFPIEKETQSKQNDQQSEEQQEETKNQWITIKIGQKKLTQMKLLNQGLVGVAFKDQGMKIWDLQKNKQVWKAKNLPNDQLNLQIPIWDTDFQVLGNTSSLQQIVTCTAYGEIREYDRRTKASPVINHLVENKQFLSCLKKASQNKIYCGDQSGHLIGLDRRKQLKSFCRISGAKGTIKSINIEGDSLVSCSLDGFMRIYSIKTQEEENKVYVKQRIARSMICKFLDSREDEEDQKESPLIQKKTK